MSVYVRVDGCPFLVYLIVCGEGFAGLVFCWCYYLVFVTFCPLVDGDVPVFVDYLVLGVYFVGSYWFDVTVPPHLDACRVGVSVFLVIFLTE